MVAANFPEAGKGVLDQLQRDRKLVETYERERQARLTSGASATMTAESYHQLFGAVRMIAARWSYLDGYNRQWSLTAEEESPTH